MFASRLVSNSVFYALSTGTENLELEFGTLLHTQPCRNCLCMKALNTQRQKAMKKSTKPHRGKNCEKPFNLESFKNLSRVLAFKTSGQSMAHANGCRQSWPVNPGLEEIQPLRRLFWGVLYYSYSIIRPKTYYFLGGVLHYSYSIICPKTYYFGGGVLYYRYSRICPKTLFDSCSV